MIKITLVASGARRWDISSDISPGRQEVRVPSTVGSWPPLKLISMIDKEYIKGIISGINKDKNEKKLVPYNASMQEIMEAVRKDVLECMRNLCNDREISYNKTLNSVSFKCL